MLVAKLTSLQRCKWCKCVWVHSNVHNQAQKTMRGHLEKCIREHVIATFVIVAVEVRMQTLDQFFEIGFSTYSDITRLRLYLYHVLEQKTLLQQSYRA